MHASVYELIRFITQHDGVGNKTTLAKQVQAQFGLTKDRSVYYCDYFAVRFSYSASGAFSNTVISLSKLQKYDALPFIACLVTPDKNTLFLANSTFLTKVSHSSQQLRVDNIRGSINGSDIAREFNGLTNAPENFEALYSIHAALGFDENLPRLVEATNNITPTGQRFIVDAASRPIINDAPERAMQFLKSADYLQLKAELDEKVDQFTNEILIAAFIDNVNIRGRIIEYLIAGENDWLRQQLVDALHSDSRRIPQLKTRNDLADYTRIFDQFSISTDVKTKVMVLRSNPKGYNIDKLLEFLATPRSVFLFYFVGINPGKIENQILVTMFQEQLLRSTILLKHWSGRNSRGVTQFEGKALNQLIIKPDNEIDLAASRVFLSMLMDL